MILFLMQDREVILDNRVRQKHIWRTVSNPGAVLWRGAPGTWKSRKRQRIRVSVALWDDGNVSGRAYRIWSTGMLRSWFTLDSVVLT